VSELPNDLERALRDLDARALRRAGSVDPDRVALRVVARLRTESEREVAVSARPWARVLSTRWVGLAAAAVVVVLAGTVAVSVLGPRGGTGVAVPVVAQALDSLDVQGLERLLSVTGQVRPVAVEPATAQGNEAWDDLSEEQLRAVLQAVQHSEETSL
jgi:hypothetical protein